MLSEKLRILHLEDSETDAAHIYRVLKKGEINFSCRVVDSRANYLLALKEFEPHLVISDHSMPAFNSIEALDILRTSGLDIPFILVTGAVSEEFAAQIMMIGADDYILKDRPKRLPSAILTALEKFSVRQAREKHENHLRNIFDGSLDILCSIDAGGRFVEISAAVEGIWGYKPAELIGKKYMDLVFEADHHITRKAAEGVMAGGTVTNFENSYRNRNGTLIPMIWSARWDDEVKIMYCVARDGTERKQSELEMSQLARRLSLATTSAGMGIWEWNIPQNHLSWDKGMYKLYELENGQFSSLYEGWLSMVHTEDRENTDNAIQMAVAGKKDYNTEFRIICGGSSIRYIRATGIIERDEWGNAWRMTGANWDITQKKEAELAIKQMNETLEKRVEERTAELVEANKDLEAYTATVSHDLRAPARAIAGFTKIIREEYGNKMAPKETELFGFIEDSATRMNAIIADLLKLAKYGNEQLKPEPVNMTRFVEDIWLNISHINPHNAQLNLKELATVMIDKSTMQQAVLNLLTNAIKYSSKKDNPIVTIWCKASKESATFYFKDNGAGFDMKNYDRLFGAFQRFHNAQDFEGTGVGLTLVKRVIEKHGGTVGAEAKVGDGATFYFTLPLI